MLIELDGTACNDALSGAPRSRECIENLLRAHRAGRHVVCLAPEQVKQLARIAGELSLQARGALDHVRWQGNEIRGLRDRVRWRMKVGVGPGFAGASVTEAGKEIIHVPLHHFEDDERSWSAVLLGENLNDTGLYVVMSKAFAAAIAWRARPSFDERLGGGDTTVQVFEQLVDQGKIVLAIVDSDHTHPGGPTGETAEKLRPVARSAFQHVHVLHVRAAENLVASAVYQEAFANPPIKPNQRPWNVNAGALPRLKQAETLPTTHAWRDHADLKKGVKLSDVQAMAAGPEKTFWSAVAADLQRDSCQQAATCAGPQGCGCYVSDALGRDTLPLAAAWLKTRDPWRNARLLGLERGMPLGDLGERVLAWGLALSARPA